MGKPATKTPAARPETKNTTPALATTGGVPADVAKMMDADAGKGVSTRQEDNLIPMLRILQDNSPQVKQRNAAYIEGAQPGMIILKSVTPPVIDGQKGFEFQPCWYGHNVVEWIPRESGGGIVGRHEFETEDESYDELCKRLSAKRAQDKENPKKILYRLPNGNELVDTRYYAGWVIGVASAPVPFVVPLSGSGHSFAKSLMFALNSQRTPSGGKRPIWGTIFRLHTRERSNAAGDWFMFDHELVRPVSTVEEYERGKTLHEAFTSGVKTMEIDEEALRGSADEDGSQLRNERRV